MMSVISSAGSDDEDDCLHDEGNGAGSCDHDNRGIR